MTFASDSQRKAVFAHLFALRHPAPSQKAVLSTARKMYPKNYLRSPQFRLTIGGRSGAQDYATVRKVMGRQYATAMRASDLGPTSRVQRAATISKKDTSADLAHELGHLRPGNIHGYSELIRKKAPILSPTENLVEEVLATVKGAHIYKKAGGTLTRYIREYGPYHATYWRYYPSDVHKAFRKSRR